MSRWYPLYSIGLPQKLTGLFPELTDFMDPQTLKNELNEAQYRAVTSPSRALLVLAGAGSGKTRVITYRLARLLKEGAAAWQILAVTFTNKAAGEMKDRIRQLAGPQADRLWVSTFHSASARILRRDIHHLGRTKDFAIYDTQDSVSVIRECEKELDISTQDFTPETFRNSISYMKNHLLGPEEAVEILASRQSSDQRGYPGLFLKVFRKYESKMEAAGALDFDDLLLFPLKLFEEHPKVLEKYQDRFRHLLVDEYQDTNRAQYQLTRLLGGKADSVCVVGDDDQSIYSWRGALIENLERFQRDFPDVEVIRLEENYRSAPAILGAATAVVNKNNRKYQKKLVARRGGSDPVIELASLDERAEAENVTGLIEKWSRETDASAYSDYAVLFRTAAQSRPLEEVLLRKRIPYIVVGGIRFYERKEIKDILSYARVALNPKDVQAFRRISGLGHWGIGPKTLDRLLERSVETGKDISQLKDEDLRDVIGPKSLGSFRAFQELLRRWIERLEEGRSGLSQWMGRMIAESGYLDRIAEKKSDRDARREIEGIRENLEQLVSAAEEFTQIAEVSLSEEDRLDLKSLLNLFLAQTSLMSDVDYWKNEQDHEQKTVEPEEEPGQVTLMTLHSAKGLEFPIVFIVGCEEELFPHGRSVADPVRLEEERRLCYVGMTRAERRLVLSHAYSRRVFGKTLPRRVSRFIEDIPHQFLRQMKTVKPPEEKTTLFNNSQSLRAGDKVLHSKFGVGRVACVSGSGMGMKVKVHFPRVGMKTLMQAYAKLRKI